MFTFKIFLGQPRPHTRVGSGTPTQCPSHKHLTIKLLASPLVCATFTTVKIKCCRLVGQTCNRLDAAAHDMLLSRMFVMCWHWTCRCHVLSDCWICSAGYLIDHCLTLFVGHPPSCLLKPLQKFPAYGCLLCHWHWRSIGWSRWNCKGTSINESAQRGEESKSNAAKSGLGEGRFDGIQRSTFVVGSHLLIFPIRLWLASICHGPVCACGCVCHMLVLCGNSLFYTVF